MSKPSSYSITRPRLQSSDDFYKKTVDRIERIQSHLSKSPRGIRLKGKVCVITGVGSMKGIGYVGVQLVDLLPLKSAFKSCFSIAVCP